jgi:hypothetical protein
MNNIIEFPDLFKSKNSLDNNLSYVQKVVKRAHELNRRGMGHSRQAAFEPFPRAKSD